MNVNRFILTVSCLALTSGIAFGDVLNGNGSWQSWNPASLNTATAGSPTGPYWNGASSDGANYNIGWCLTGTGNCHIASAPGALTYYGNGTAAASNMYFTGSGAAQQVSLLGLFSNQNGVPPSGTDYFGWYSINNGVAGPLNQLLSSTQPVGTAAVFDPTSTYGLYFENVQSPGASYTASYYWLSNTALSYVTGTGVSDNGTQHFSIFGTAGSSTYYIGMEDAPAPNSDFDYNDMIVELQPASAPEPAAFGFVAAGMGLLGLVVRRRKA